MKSFTLFILLTVFFLSAPPQVTCQDLSVQQLLSSSNSYLEQGKNQQAFNVLFEAFQLEPDDPEINYKLGIAANKIGDYETAAMAFERVLIADPSLVQAKLELAKAFYRLGSTETAKQYFQEVIESDIPENTRKNIKNFLKSISQGTSD